MRHEAIEVPLLLLDEPPEWVDGEHAFVLYQPEIGRIEVGSPLPDDEIWNHFTGDLRFTAVHELSGGVSGGGGGPTSDDGQLDVLWSDGSGDDRNETAWVVAGLIPSQYLSVVVEQGGIKLTQQPIHRTAAIPLGPGVVARFEILGIDESGAQTLLYED